MPAAPPAPATPTEAPAPGTFSRFDLEVEQLALVLEGQPRFRAKQIFEGMHKRLTDPEDQTDLPKSLRESMPELLPPALTEVARSATPDGDTVKWLWQMRGGATIETVLMHYDDRSTVCVSTQAGCAMACGFCATGQAGFERHLTRGEIVEQVVRAAREAQAVGRRVSNVVFMGMGEPLANYDNTWAAVERLHGAIGISARGLTVSTVGIVPGIRRFTREALPVNLAVSLHAANDQLRNELVPINRRYPLAILHEACRQYLTVRNRRLSFEWAMIHGVNDSPRDVDELAAFAAPLRAHVNLIPLNPTPGWPTRGSSRERVREFRHALDRAGVNATIRKNRGTDIAAACGQLRADHEISVDGPRRRRRLPQV